MFLLEFLDFCLDGVGKEEARQAVEVILEDLTSGRLLQGGLFLVFSK